MFGSALLQPTSSVCVSLNAFFIVFFGLIGLFFADITQIMPDPQKMFNTQISIRMARSLSVSQQFLKFCNTVFACNYLTLSVHNALFTAEILTTYNISR